MWLGLANLNLTLTDPETPVTVSPTENVPEAMVTSRSFGIIYDDMSTLSKNGYTNPFGFILLATNSMFLLLIVWIMSVETTLSPTLTLSHLSLTLYCIPLLDWLVVVIVETFSNVVNSSSIVVVTSDLPLPFFLALLFLFLLLFFFFFGILETSVDRTVLPVFMVSTVCLPASREPVQFVSHAPQLTGESPVLLSIPNWSIVDW